ncbi:MAG: peptide chain release factor-like protein [Lachnospiraceae bacterium]|nr:peptide chain release factor-like protein [Lachnospiraceae bacterium]
MIIQISAGPGPAECAMAVEKLCQALLKEYPGSEVVTFNEDYSGHGYRSAVMSIEQDVTDLVGSVQWICKSPIRPGHLRKNWFIEVSVIPEAEEAEGFDLKDCQIESMHCGGKGGQNVNKVETGIRIRHIPTGITVVCTEERTQYMNKAKAIRRLKAILSAAEADREDKRTKDIRHKHFEIERGNPVRVYRGEGFIRENRT